ncbi:MAG TPA: response regulator [Gaiellaceae bacterium]|nr:response regulator [Gaiellaceae bacterium]
MDDPLRVLIADDETIIRLDLRDLLERQGIRVCGEARDGEEAVALARTLEPDAVLLDVRMPKLDGIAAARRIYAERPVPIVMLTAFADRASIDRAIEANAFSYLVKPFREQDVAAALRTAVARHDELLRARRAIGEKPQREVVLGLRSTSGGAWPNLRLGREPDGSLRVDTE